MNTLKQAQGIAAATLMLCAYPTLADDAALEEAQRQPAAAETEEKDVVVYINQVLKPYTLIKKIVTEVQLIDAKSEEDAELQAFRQLKAQALAFNADGLIEVKRSLIKDDVAARVTTLPGDSMLRDDIDATAEVIDELTLDSYDRGQGTLSTTPIDPTFNQERLSQRSVRFTGKAIRFK